MPFILWLPQELLHLIAHCFLPQEQHYKQVFKYRVDWKNFMNTSKYHFGKWKKESQVITLKDRFAEKFFVSTRFRQRVQCLVENSQEQLEIHVNNPLYIKLKSHYQDTIRNAGINRLLVVLSLGDRDMVLTLTESGQILRKFNWRYYNRVAGTYAETDLVDNEIVEEASFYRFRLLNYHCLSHLKSITIAFPAAFTDVSCFHSVPKLHFHCCHQVTDVSSLRNVRELELKSCDGITDVSSLGTVYSLSLQECRNLAQEDFHGGFPQETRRDLQGPGIRSLTG
jgi:hypothetical protein